MTDERDTLLAELAEARAALLAAVDGVEAATAARRPAPEEWSVLENLLHVADMELLTVQHIGRILAVDEPPLSGARGDEFAAERTAAGALGLPGALARLATVRAALLATCDGLDAPALERGGYHPKFGRRTIAGWLRQRAKHERDHREQVLATLAVLSAEC